MDAAEPQDPLAVVEELVPVEYSVFMLQAHPSAAVALDLGLPEGLVRGGTGGATFRSAATDHYAPVRLELWAAAPPPMAVATWPLTESAELVCDAGQLRLASVTAWISENPLLLPGPGKYGVRALVARTAPIPPPPALGFERGLERWLVQVWPA